MSIRAAIVLIGILPTLARAQSSGDCSVYWTAVRGAYNESRYKDALTTIDRAQSSCDTYAQLLQKTKIDCLLELDTSSAVVRQEVLKLLRMEPRFDTNKPEISMDVKQYIRTFDVYPKLIVGVSMGIPFTWTSQMQSEPVFSEQTSSTYKFDALNSLAYGPRVEFFVKRQWSIEAGYDYTNYSYQRTIQFQSDNPVYYSERLRYNSFQATIHYCPNSIPRLNVGVGYIASSLIGATGEIYGEGLAFTGGIDQTPYRHDVIQSATLGVGYRVLEFLDHRAFIAVQAKYTHGLSEVNNYDQRYDNPLLSQYYYYTDDNFRLNSIAFEVSARYKLIYHIKTFK
ncbi:MAG: hypothetical protein QM762_14725 [Chryseolinea sp.]